MDRLRLEQHPAGEIDAEIEALDGDGNDCDQQQDAVGRKGVVAPADEIDVGVVGQKSQMAHDASGFGARET